MLFPACAGVILPLAVNRKCSASFPRVCGGDPIQTFYNKDFNLFSPRVRG